MYVCTVVLPYSIATGTCCSALALVLLYHTGVALLLYGCTGLFTVRVASKGQEQVADGFMLANIG